MSDFKFVLSARNQEEYEVRLWQWTKPLLMKWWKQELTEREGHLLLLAWSGEDVRTLTDRQERKSVRLRTKEDCNGLHYAAFFFGKDAKTIRRWCKTGHFPGATQTAGGHWRIPRSTLKQVYNSYPEGFGRRSRTLFGTKAWKRFSSVYRPLFFERLRQVVEMQAAIEDKSNKQFSSDKPSISDDAIHALGNAVNGEVAEYGMLRAKARRLHLDDPSRKVTAARLADFLGIHRTTLYRRYSAKDVNSAIRNASDKLNSREEAVSQDFLTEQEKDKASIAEEFRKRPWGHDSGGKRASHVQWNGEEPPGWNMRG